MDKRRKKDEDWTKVEDAAERKKIQNRLAQRIHRMKYGRKKTSKSVSKISRVGNEPSSSRAKNLIKPTDHDTLNKASRIVSSTSSTEAEPSHIDEVINSSPDSSTTLTEDLFLSYPTLSLNLEVATYVHQYTFLICSDQSTSSLQPKTPSPLTDTHFLILHQTNTISALLFNASLLNIACSNIRGRSIFISFNLTTPPSLSPIPLQLTLPHWPYIDIIPLPALRNKLLQAHDIIDPREIWQDLVNGEIKMWGTQSWDERGWEIGERFATKWWFLMDEEVLGGTNFWRASRGEAGLDLGRLKGRMAGVGAG